MTESQEIVRAYGAAWLATDPGERRAHLEQAWADDGIYIDTNTRVEGREALAQLIEQTHTAFPGHIVELTSGALGFKGYLQFTWHMRRPDGEILLTGTDFARQGDDGRLVELIGFFGAPPPLDD
ncbi:nuclear transport factor 2 family protein [Fontisubflavum oceani]|uniref:nuclear transport factor 2 family protein n=1 Tax=Fontisubflavum oceani TaxID=2978973 RepID=UPI0025B5EF14|nr:nuclear transport factor 2 family protein [Fontisubflavum oceani]WJY20852.1 nuclear transport factor 2 family protein [Fontisubflavum oceani]